MREKVSVPYWGSHFLIKNVLLFHLIITRFRPLLGFSLSNRFLFEYCKNKGSFRPLLGFSLSNP